MLLFHGIKFSKMKCFIDIIAKIFTNIWINIVKKKYSVFQISSRLRIQSKNAGKNSCQACHKEQLLSNFLMVQVQKWPFFHIFFFHAIQARKMSFTIFQNQKKPFQAIKRRSSKSRKIDIFPKGLTHGFGPKMAIFPTFFFQAIQARKMSFTIFQNQKTPFKAIKTQSSKSRKIDIFPKGLTHGFGPKMAIFSTFFFRQYRPRKRVLRYSRTKKPHSRL